MEGYEIGYNKLPETLYAKIHDTKRLDRYIMKILKEFYKSNTSVLDVYLKDDILFSVNKPYFISISSNKYAYDILDAIIRFALTHKKIKSLTVTYPVDLHFVFFEDTIKGELLNVEDEYSYKDIFTKISKKIMGITDYDFITDIEEFAIDRVNHKIKNIKGSSNNIQFELGKFEVILDINKDPDFNKIKQLMDLSDEIVDSSIVKYIFNFKDTNISKIIKFIELLKDYYSNVNINTESFELNIDSNLSLNIKKPDNDTLKLLTYLMDNLNKNIILKYRMKWYNIPLMVIKGFNEADISSDGLNRLLQESIKDYINLMDMFSMSDRNNIKSIYSDILTQTIKMLC